MTINSLNRLELFIFPSVRPSSSTLGRVALSWPRALRLSTVASASSRLRWSRPPRGHQGCTGNRFRQRTETVSEVQAPLDADHQVVEGDEPADQEHLCQHPPFAVAVVPCPAGRPRTALPAGDLIPPGEVGAQGPAGGADPQGPVQPSSSGASRATVSGSGGWMSSMGTEKVQQCSWRFNLGLYCPCPSSWGSIRLTYQELGR